MSYTEDNDKAIKVLEGARAEQEGINGLALEDIARHSAKLQQAQLRYDSSKALIDAIDASLDRLYAVEADNDPLDTGVDDFDPPITDEDPGGEDSGNGYTYEDPHDVAFGKSDEQQPDPGRTFAHRAPMQGEDQAT